MKSHLLTLGDVHISQITIGIVFSTVSLYLQFNTLPTELFRQAVLFLLARDVRATINGRSPHDWVTSIRRGISPLVDPHAE
jgi:hypothetical protein